MLKSHRGHRALTLLLLGALPNCTFLSDGGKRAPKSPQQDQAITAPRLDDGAARVQGPWQEAFLQHLASLDAKRVRAWALVSYSGWSDWGQYFFLEEEGSKKLRFYAVPENFGKATNKPQEAPLLPSRAQGSWQLAPAAWQHFAKPLGEKDGPQWLAILKSFEALDDLQRTAFDGLEVEFMAVTKDGGKIAVQKRVYMNTPDEANGPKHLECLTAFRKMLGQDS